MTRTAFGADAIAYARGDGTGHNGAKTRNDYIAGVNLLPDSVVPFEQQMQPFWNKADPRHKIQIDRFIVSFSPDELDPARPESCVTALAIGCEIARRNAPDNQSAVFVQTDGAGGKVHIHILTNDVTMTDYKGLDPKAYAHFCFRPIVDEVCRQYFDLARPELAPERINQTVRGARMKNEQIKAENALEVRRAAAAGRPADIKPLKYIWQDDLRERIKAAAREAADEASFAQRLRLNGVELVPHQGKDGSLSYLHQATKKQPAHYTYELTDVSSFDRKIPQNLKSKSFKLGTDYQPEGVARLFRQQAPAAPSPVQLRPAPAPPPGQAKEKPPEKSPGAIRQDPELERVKALAKKYVLPILRRIIPDADADAMFERFTRWRVMRREEERRAGRKFPPIYHKDAQGKGSVLYERLEAQYTDFLDETMQAEAERQRQLLRKQREALSAEVRRTAAYVAERQRSQAEGPDYTDG